MAIFLSGLVGLVAEVAQGRVADVLGGRVGGFAGWAGGVVDGLSLDETGLELLAAGIRVGRRRVLAAADVEVLDGISHRYARAVDAGSDAGVLVELGRDLYRWLDADQRF